MNLDKNNNLDKRKLVEEAVSRIDKQYGKGSVMNLGKMEVPVEIETISTGSLLVDIATGVNGLPRGRIVEVYGPEASGKTTIALQAMAECQKKGGVVAFIDAEHALDLAYASNLGIKIEELFLSQPDYAEQALDIVETLVRSGGIDLIVVDSVAALVPKNEVEGEMGDSHMGLQARLMSQALRKLTPLVHKSKVCLIFINQIRQNIGAMAFGPKETTTGGNALKFYASMRLDVRRIEAMKDKEGKHFGNKIAIKIAKNKVAPPFRTTQTHLVFGSGISRYFELLDIALSKGVIEQNGSWFSHDGNKLCQGRDSLIELLKKDNVLFENLYNRSTKDFEKNLIIEVNNQEL